MAKENPKSWETLPNELFTLFLTQIIPGGVAVFLYAPPLATGFIEHSDLGNFFVILIPAWIVGVLVDVISLHLPLFVLRPCKGWLKSKYGGLLEFLLPCLSWACDKTGDMRVEYKVFCAFPEMLRNLAVISICVRFSPPDNFIWTSGEILREWAGWFAAASLLGWGLLHWEFKRLQCEHKIPDGPL